MSKSPYKVIMLRGMEDVPGWINKHLASYFDATIFNSRWVQNHPLKHHNNKEFLEESFEQKLKRLHAVVQETQSNGQKVIFVGVSAGAGLGLSYLIKYPKNPVVHLVSLNGILWDWPASLDPQSKKQLSQLTQQCKNIKEMINFFHKTKSSGIMTFNHIQNKISITTSGDYDGIVPAILTKPSWVTTERVFFSTKLPHTMGIIWGLLVKLKSHLKVIRQLND